MSDHVLIELCGSVNLLSPHLACNRNRGHDGFHSCSTSASIEAWGFDFAAPEGVA